MRIRMKVQDGYAAMHFTPRSFPHIGFAMDYIAILQGLLDGGQSQEEVAKLFGVSQSTVSRWIKGSKFDAETARKIEQAGADFGLIVGDRHFQFQSKIPIGNQIPEIDVIAGMGGGGLSTIGVSSSNGITFASEVVRDHWRLPDWMMNRMNVRASHVAAFPTRGDSMAPTIQDGDVVFVDTRHRVPSPPGIYALADEFGGVVIKRLEVVSSPGVENPVIRISSDNPRHTTRDLTLDEIHIIGAYVGRFTV